MALEAIHALCAIPEVFAGDPKNKPNPDEDPAVYGHYKKLFALRKQYPELAKGELLLDEVQADNNMVLTALRRLNDKVTLVVVSLSNQEENVQVILPEQSISGNMKLIDGLSNEAIKSICTRANTIQIKLKPFQVVVGF